MKFWQNNRIVSTKKTFFHGPEGLKYFLIISLLLHGALFWSILYLGREGGWLARQRPDMKTPEYLQVVQLPPGYKVPKNNLRPPKKPKRYADRTSVVEKENIPGGKAVLLRPIPGSKAGQKSRASRAVKAAKAVKAVKKSSGVAKPRRIFKTKKGTARGKGLKKAALTPKKKASTAGAKEKAIKESKLSAQLIPPVSEGELIQSGKKKKARKKGTNSKKTVKSKSLTASKGKGNEKSGGGKTLNPDAGRRASAGRSATPASPSRPNLLLSNNQVSRLARRYEGSGPRTKSKTLMLNTSELKYQKYLMALRHKIEQYWEYPRAAAMRGWQGKLFIDFTIKRDGTVSDISLSRSSRYPVLDDAAITALKLSAPFSTFPDNFEIDELKIHGQFVYSLLNAYRN